MYMESAGSSYLESEVYNQLNRLSYLEQNLFDQLNNPLTITETKISEISNPILIQQPSEAPKNLKRKVDHLENVSKRSRTGDVLEETITTPAFVIAEVVSPQSIVERNLNLLQKLVREEENIGKLEKEIDLFLKNLSRVYSSPHLVDRHIRNGIYSCFQSLINKNFDNPNIYRYYFELVKYVSFEHVGACIDNQTNALMKLKGISKAEAQYYLADQYVEKRFRAKSIELQCRYVSICKSLYSTNIEFKYKSCSFLSYFIGLLNSDNSLNIDLENSLVKDLTYVKKSYGYLLRSIGWYYRNDPVNFQQAETDLLKAKDRGSEIATKIFEKFDIDNIVSVSDRKEFYSNAMPALRANAVPLYREAKKVIDQEIASYND